MDVQQFYSAFAATYEADYGARTEDIAFYLQLARESGGPVLEMACGTGRVLRAIARAGIAVHGLDLSSHMLEQLEASLALEPLKVQRRVAITRGDIRSTRVDGEFPLVIAPFRGVQHLLERDQQRAWLRNVARHLAPGGALCFDVFQPNFKMMTENVTGRVQFDRTDPAGRRIRLFTDMTYHNEFQTADITFHRVVEDAAGTRVAESRAGFTLYWYTRGELYNLLELEGFRITAYWGSFDRQPFGEGSPEQIVRAVRA